MYYNCVITLFAPNAAKYLQEVHQREEIKNITTITAPSSCGARFKSEKVNELFSKELKKLITKSGMVEVYERVLQDEFNTKTRAQREDVKQVKSALEKASELSNARKLILSGDIEPSEYRLIKTDYEMKRKLRGWNRS